MQGADKSCDRVHEALRPVRSGSTLAVLQYGMLLDRHQTDFFCCSRSGGPTADVCFDQLRDFVKEKSLEVHFPEPLL